MPSRYADFFQSTARNDSTCQPLDTGVTEPSGATSSSRAVTIASDRFVETKSRAIEVPAMRRSRPVTGRSNATPALSLTRWSPVQTGSAGTTPAVHCSVDSEHAPAAGSHGMVEVPDFGCALSVPGEPGAAVPLSEMRLYRVPTGG